MSTFLDPIYLRDTGTIGTQNTPSLITIEDDKVTINGALTTNGNVVVLDPAGQLDSLYSFRVWSSATTYAINEPCFYLGVPYKSLQAGNVNNTPSSSPTYWEVTGGSGGSTNNVGFNFTNGQFESTTLGWNLYNDTTAVPVDGTGGTATITFTRNSTLPLTGVGDGVITKGDSASKVGQGVSYDFTIDRGQVTQTAQVSFIYETSANYADSDIGIYIYDITNNNLMYPSIVNVPATYGKPSTFLATFIPSTSSSYRLLFHTQSTSAQNYTIKIDNIQIGNKSVAVGAAIGNWTAYTPTVTGFGTSPTVTGFYRRVGSNLEFRIKVHVTNTTGADGFRVSYLPSGLTLDDTNLGSSSGRMFGTSSWTNVATGLVYVGTMYTETLTEASMYGPSLTGAWNATVPTAITTNTVVIVSASVPISQWTSNVNLASDFTEYASNSSNTDANDTTSFVSGQEGSQGIFGYSITTYRLKRVRFSNPIQKTDVLQIEIYDTVAEVWLPINTMRSGTFSYVLQASQDYGMYLVGVNSTDIDVGFSRYISPGATYGGAGSGWNAVPTSTRWRVRKVSNGNMAEIPPLVRAEYTFSSGTTAGVSTSIIQLNTKIEDTHNAVTTGSNWKFTAPISGIYNCEMFADIGGNRTSTSNSVSFVGIFKNGSHIKWSSKVLSSAGNWSGIWNTLIVNKNIRLNAGDYIHFALYYVGDMVQSADVYPTGNHFSLTIVRLGS